MRPHVELIHESDYILHPGELPKADRGEAAQKNLSVDEEDGSASTQVDFISNWSRPAGRHVADTEWYVLSGEIAIGDTVMGPGGYVHAPKGVAIPKMEAKEGTRVLLFREYGDWGFETVESNADYAREPLTVIDTSKIDWTAVDKPGPKPGLMIKMLHQNAETGFYSRLIWAKPGWDDHRLAHHPVYEEAYTIGGSMVYNFGDLVTGTYFFRPAWVKHGHFISHEPEGCTWLIRSDGELTNYYTTNERVIVEGDAENYGPENAPKISSMPVRSRTAGEWDHDGL